MSFDLKVADGDLVINNGDFKQVIDGEKLVQDILKIALTKAGSNPMYPWYGSYISRSIIGSNLNAGITMQVGQSQLQNAIQTLMELQAAQVRSGQSMSADEQIKSILDISVNRNENNPTFYIVKIRVLSKGLKQFTTTFEVAP